MTLRLASTWLVAFGISASSAWAQEAVTNDVQQGHHLAVLICSNCHIAARDQPFEPILRPAVPGLLSSAAQDCGADLVVLGAYGRSRMHEILFGSCTQSMIRNAETAVLLMH